MRKGKRKPFPIVPTMTAPEFDAALDRLGFSQVGLSLFFGRDDRTMRRWSAGSSPIPPEAALALRLMVRFKVRAPASCRSTR